MYSYVIVNELLDYINKNLGYRILVPAGSEICKLPIVGAKIKIENVSSVSSGDVKVYLPADYEESGLLNISYVYFNEELTAPVSKGQVVGNIIVSYGDEILSISDIVIGEDVERDTFIYSLWLMKAALSSRMFVVATVSFIIIFIGYLLFRAPKRKRRKASKYRYK